MTFNTETAYLSLSACSGKSVSNDYNPLVQKEYTYRILSSKYEEKRAKYYKATPEYKQTAEYERLGAIVSRLHATLVQMEQDMAR